MNFKLQLILVFCVGVLCSHIDKKASYLENRAKLLTQEQNTLLGQALSLTQEEQAVNMLLMSMKMSELEHGVANNSFPPASHFFIAKNDIKMANTYKVIRLMPKGAALHVHGSSLASVSWVISELTYWDDLYMCYTSEDQLLMKFMLIPDTYCSWELVRDVRASHPSSKDFDDMLLSQLSIFTDKPTENYPNINAVWSAFEKSLKAISGILTYRPALEAYLYHALLEFMEDNILYVELRANLRPLYELNGTKLTIEHSLGIYEATCERFLADHRADYFGTRFIYGTSRNTSKGRMWEKVVLAKQLKKSFPSFMVGFDLVGQEDTGLPLIEFLDPLLSLSDEREMKVFYHAGETNWMGLPIDENLIDALLLNATRIGHGYALAKHPEAKRLALARDISLEVCPISNQVLMLVSDLRNHPASILISEGFPIVISGDGRGALGSDPLSHDFYQAFMALGGAKADLRFLKQLAINSIKYAALDKRTKSQLMQMWQRKWQEFLQMISKLYSIKEKSNWHWEL